MNVVLPFPSGTIIHVSANPEKMSPATCSWNGSSTNRRPLSSLSFWQYARKCSTVNGSSRTPDRVDVAAFVAVEVIELRSARLQLLIPAQLLEQQLRRRHRPAPACLIQPAEQLIPVRPLRFRTLSHANFFSPG